MPRLLFLAHPFPPCPAVGAVRTGNIARYLAGAGWNVTVVTPDPALWRRRDESAGSGRSSLRIRRILTGHGWRCLDPDLMRCRNTDIGWLVGGCCRRIARWRNIDSGIGWIRAAERACSDIAAEDVDVILSTGSPFASFRLAKRLSERLRRPYVLDYRDPYSTNPHVASGVRQAVMREESQLLRGCAAATVVSPSWAEGIDNSFGVGTKLHVITNAYDPDELDSVPPHDFGHFAIVYSGTFYPPKRVITPLLAALSRVQALGNQVPDWAFHYYGSQESHVLAEAARFSLRQRVVTHGPVPRAEVLSAVRGAALSVVITTVEGSASFEDKGIVPAKLFEAVGLKTPTLLIAPPGTDAGVIAHSAGLIERVSGDDSDGIADFIIGAMAGRLPQPRNRQVYSWDAVVRRLDHVLRSAAGHSSLLRTAT
jgi:glycosyltransferase involved in cell wall biosynthesis